MLYYHLSIIAISVFFCYKWGDWRHWRKYYPTMQYFIMGDLIYCILFHNSLLWMYVTDVLNHTLVNLMMMFTVYPSIVLLFLPYYPKGFIKETLYIIFWMLLVVTVEFVSYSLGQFSYHNHWNIGWSLVFSLLCFY